MSDNETQTEERILSMMKKVLTDIARDTYTTPGMKHPLSEQTIAGIRDCLALITARETEIKSARGEKSTAKPKLPGDKADKVVVQLKPHKDSSD